VSPNGTPEPAAPNGADNGAVPGTVKPAAHQPWCSADVPAGAERCPRCKAWQPDNLAASDNPMVARYRRSGEVPPNLRLSAEELLAGIVADLGGAEALTTIEMELVRTLADLRAARLLLMVHVQTAGITSKSGRAAYEHLLGTADRIHRLATTIGTKRRARRVAPTTLAGRLADLPDIAAGGGQ